MACAAPAYLPAHGALATIDDLATHRCSVFRHPGTGRVLPWYFKVGNEVKSRDFSPALSTNDTELEAEAVLSGYVLDLISGLSAAAHIHSRRLVPLLIAHATDHMSVHVYYSNRTADAGPGVHRHRGRTAGWHHDLRAQC